MKEKVKELRFNFVVAAVLYAVLGFVLLVWPKMSSSIICYAIGTVMLIFGAVNIIAFVASKEKTALLAAELVVGVAAAAFGLLSLFRPDTILAFLPVLVGIFIIVISFMSVKRAFELRHYLYDRWWITLLLSVLAIALGLLILFHPRMTTTVITRLSGCVFLYVGVCELISIHKASVLSKEYLKTHPVAVDPIDPV